MSDIHGTREELVAMIVEQRGEIQRLRGVIISACHHLDAGRLDEAWKTLTSIIEAKP